MDPYRQLLESCGIFDHEIPPDPSPTKPPPTIINPRQEIVIENTFGPRDNPCWEDLDSREQPTYALDYHQEIDFHMNYKRKHRYSRKDRFRHTLFQLMGMVGETPKHVIKLVRENLGKRIKKQKLWNDIRTILKQHNLRKYYNRISSIIKELTGLVPLGNDSGKIKAMIDNFYLFDHRFDTTFRSVWTRRYFPNLRFVALKLIEANGVVFPYHVPLMRTARKKKYLETLFNQLQKN